MIDVDEYDLREHSRVFVLSAILAGYGALLLSRAKEAARVRAEMELQRHEFEEHRADDVDEGGESA